MTEIIDTADPPEGEFQTALLQAETARVGQGGVVMAAPLRACPFCRSRDLYVERGDFSSAYVTCNNCSARGPVACQERDDEETPGEASARKAWNRIPPPTPEQKAACIGEFYAVYETPDRPPQHVDVPITWTMIKAIYKAMLSA